jgi:hypothetical protein
MGERACSEMMNEQVTATSERESGLSRPGTDDVRVEQAQVRPRIERTDPLQRLTLKHEAESAEPLRLQPLPPAALRKLARKAIDGFDIDQHAARAAATF